MLVSHIFGLPFEETAVQLAPVGAATVTLIAIADRTKLRRTQRHIRRLTRRLGH